MAGVTLNYLEAIEKVIGKEEDAQKLVAKKIGDALASPSFYPFDRPLYIEAMALLLALLEDESPPLIEPLLATIVPGYIRTRDNFKFMRSMQRAIRSYRNGKDPYMAMLELVDSIRLNVMR